jgi:hypothetical protein
MEEPVVEGSASLRNSVIVLGVFLRRAPFAFYVDTWSTALMGGGVVAGLGVNA